MEYTLGISTMGSSSAALFKNGFLIAAVEEERLSRIKNDNSFPYKSIKEVLEIAQIKINDISTIAVYWQPWRIWSRASASCLKIISSPLSRKYLINQIKILSSSSSTSTNGSWYELFKIKKIIKNHFGFNKAKIIYFDHHLTHQKYSAAMLDDKEFISLSYDGGGESYSTVLKVYKKDGDKILSKHKWPNSLGHFYSTFTGFLGFKMLEGEYKLMGLAPYGKPIWKDLILDKILNLNLNGTYSLNTKLCDYHAAIKGKYNIEFENLFCKKRASDEDPTKEHIDLAASVQAAFEEALLHILKPATEKYPHIKSLVLSGGCALNVSANGKLLRSDFFDKVYIPPAPHDAGCAIGAALCYLKEYDLNSIRNPYLGRYFSDLEIENQIKMVSNLDPKSLLNSEKNLIDKTIKLLAKGNVVGWFQGRAEFGPRALGSRSFLADPRKDSIKDEINSKIKKRENFRPFAPSTIQDKAYQNFEISQNSPYMNLVVKVLNKNLPAITHIDHTARVHTVTKKMNPIYYQLLEKFGKLTGFPVLLNTSLNIQEPIVYSPEDAINTFLNSGADALVIGNYLLKREDLKCI